MAKQRDYKVSINQVWWCPILNLLIHLSTFEIDVIDCTVEFELFEQKNRTQIHLFVDLAHSTNNERIFIAVFECAKKVKYRNFVLSKTMAFSF